MIKFTVSHILIYVSAGLGTPGSSSSGTTTYKQPGVPLTIISDLTI
ncbi:hypothetical protein [Methanosarcina sp. MSH10X1]|nr:hypothetical protein [Methanosarcina sp. MSH10X1]